MEAKNLKKHKKSVNEKLISPSKKEMGNFIWANLRIGTQQGHLRKLWEVFLLLEVKYSYISFLRQKAGHLMTSYSLYRRRSWSMCFCFCFQGLGWLKITWERKGYKFLWCKRSWYPESGYQTKTSSSTERVHQSHPQLSWMDDLDTTTLISHGIWATSGKVWAESGLLLAAETFWERAES